jgi:hypothetical protein
MPNWNWSENPAGRRMSLDRIAEAQAVGAQAGLLEGVTGASVTALGAGVARLAGVIWVWGALRRR